MNSPEDKVVADYETYDKWCQEAAGFGVDCCELIGWDKGGLERDYPAYIPEEKLGGKAGFKKLMKSINACGDKVLAFVNANVLDSDTEWYKAELHQHRRMDLFGNTQNWMAWGESTLTARKGWSVRRHVHCSLTPRIQQILEDQFCELVRDGAHGLQIDKVVVGSYLDFNPLNTEKPDVALCEGLVRGIARIHEKCRAIDPEFRIASEACQDRLLPYVDVFYRSAETLNISPLRTVFPEWTACLHIASPCDFLRVNAAVMNGAVICIEPEMYQASLGHPLYRRLAEYVHEVERIRQELKEIIFLGNFYDMVGARIVDAETGAHANDPPGALHFRVHGHRETGRRATIVVNTSECARSYVWEFLERPVAAARLYTPFSPVSTVQAGTELSIQGESVHILVDTD